MTEIDPNLALSLTLSYLGGINKPTIDQVGRIAVVDSTGVNLEYVPWLAGVNTIKVAKTGGDYGTIQAAIDASSPTAALPCVISIGPGLYEEEVTLKDYVYLVGVHRDAVRIQYESPTGAVIFSNYSGLENVTVLSAGDTSDNSLVFSNVSNWIVRRVSVTAAGGVTARAVSASGATWSGGLFEDCRLEGLAPAASSVLISGSGGQDVACVFRRCQLINEVFSPLDTSGCDGVVLDGCHIAGGSYGLQADGATGTAMTIRSSVVAGDVGVVLQDGHTLDVLNSDVSGYTLDNGAVLNLDGRSVESLDSATYSWENQGSASYTLTRNGEYSVVKPHHAANPSLTLRVRSAPTPPYTYTARIRGWPKVDFKYGLAWRNSATNAIVAALFLKDTLSSDRDDLHVLRYDNVTTYNGSYAAASGSPAGSAWLRLEDNGTNRIVSISLDGETWFALHSVGRTDFTTADQIGIVIEANNAAAVNLDAMMLIDHLLLES